VSTEYLWNDTDEIRTKYSFFKYENCASLFKDMLINFGLVWRTNYTIPDKTKPWAFKIDFELRSRFTGETKELTHEIFNDMEGEILEQDKGVVVDVTNYGSATNANGLADDLNDNSVNEKTIRLSTPFASYQAEWKSANFWDVIKQCFVGRIERPLEYFKTESAAVVAPINSFQVLRNVNGYNKYLMDIRYGNVIDLNSTFAPPLYVTLNTNKVNGTPYVNLSIHKRLFGKFIANYYCSLAECGIYTGVQQTLKFSINTIDIEPLDVIPIRNKKYIVMQVEKDFINSSSKLVLKEY